MSDPHLNAAGYALDALADYERADFWDHLAGCTECQARLSEFSETAAELSAVTETEPPEHLRGDVLSAITNTPQLPEEETADQHAAAEQPTTGEPGQTRDQPEQGHPVDGAVRWTRPRWRRIGQIAITAAMAVVLAVGGWIVGQQQAGQSEQAGSPGQSRLLGASDARIYRKPMRNGAHVSYVVSQKQNAAMAFISGEPEPSSGHAFQLWTMHGAKADKAKPDRTFTGSESGPVWLKGNVSSAAALAITVEPDGGSPHPTTDPFAVQEL